MTKKQNQYIYPAIFQKAEDVIYVKFPDFMQEEFADLPVTMGETKKKPPRKRRNI